MKRIPISAFSIVCVLIMLVVAFRPLESGQFLYWDDDVHIFKNPIFFNLSFESFIQIWTHTIHRLFIPVVYSIWGILVLILQFFSIDFRNENLIQPFTTLNFLFHITNGILLFKLLPFFAKEISKIGKLFCVIIFLLHPLQVESVVWVSGFRDVACVTFSLLFLLFYFKEIRFLTVISLLLAILSKPNAISLPLLLIGFELLRQRDSVPNVFIRRFYNLVLLTFSAVPFALLTIKIQTEENLVFAPSFYERILVSVDTIGFYILKIFWPYSLSHNYGRTPLYVMKNTPTFELLIGFLVISFSIYTYFKFRKNQELTSFLIPLFYAPLATVLGLIPFLFQQYSTVADRYVAISIIPVAVLVSLATDKIAMSWIFRTLIVCSLFVATFNYSKVWKSPTAFYNNTINSNNNFSTNELNYASYLDKMGKFAEALKHARAAVILDPANPIVLNSLGVLLVRNNQTEEAQALYLRTVNLFPDNTDTRIGLGTLLINLNKLDDAILHLKAAVNLNPKLDFAHYQLGVSYCRLGLKQLCLEHLNTASNISPHNKLYRDGITRISE